MIHYTHSYLIQPAHKVTIDLVGLGGTGSQVLTCLARINQSLMGLGHPGLHVRAWDPDMVTEANLGRQLFSKADLFLNKSHVLVTRVNRFFGMEWESMPVKYTGTLRSNILITCVDTAKMRLQLHTKLHKARVKKNTEPTDYPFYWLDIGNLQKTGQCVLGTFERSNIQKKGTRAALRNVVQVFPQIRRINEEKQGPSCSLAEALEKQDLFINSTLAQFGCNLLWKLIREGHISYQGAFVNLDSFTVNPIRIK